ncbi:MAG TPA: hypothetical protein VJN43_24075 [Bryobacteraceae bacterium]|nr:hypothetical protein [Bryobacteraceae bacterium]
MARGWESKSVEAQIESAAAKNNSKHPELSPKQVEMLRARENLELSRTRVKRELETSTNPRYQVILRKALADLEAKLIQFDPATRAAAAASGR